MKFLSDDRHYVVHAYYCRLAWQFNMTPYVQGVDMLLPSDVVCTYDLDADEACCQRPLTRSCCTSDAPCIPDTAFGADIGPGTCSHYVDALRDCQCVFWNGPMGKFEVPAYAHGTQQVAKGIAAATRRGATTIVGGALLHFLKILWNRLSSMQHAFMAPQLRIRCSTDCLYSPCQHVACASRRSWGLATG